MNKEKNKKCMQSSTFEADTPDLATQKRLWQSETLKKLGYEWSNDYQVWASQIDYSLPVLANSQARALANSIHDFSKSQRKKNEEL